VRETPTVLAMFGAFDSSQIIQINETWHTYL